MSRRRKNIYGNIEHETIQGYGNLFVYLFVAITSLVVGVIVAPIRDFRQEKVQRELVGLRAETDRQMTLAQLDVERVCIPLESCKNGIKPPSSSYSQHIYDGAIIVTNSGSAAAQDVQIVITLLDISDYWSNTISGITNFERKIFPSTVNSIITPTQVSTVDDSYRHINPNALRINVPRIQPKGNVRVQVLPLLPSSVPTKTYAARVDVAVFMPQGNPQLQNSLESLLGEYLSRNHHLIALFRVDITCSNCEGNENDLQFWLSSLNGWSYKFVDLYSPVSSAHFSLVDPALSKRLFRQRDTSNLIKNISLSFQYALPQNIGHKPDESLVVLKVEKYTEAGQERSHLVDMLNSQNK